MKLRALDLFSCAGGATRGLQLAGFHVTGVDIVRHKNYCGDAFIQADALTVDLSGYDFIWASPPCQRFSDLAKRNGNAHEWPDLIKPIREKLKREADCPWVIENVEGAPLINPVLLCGTMFPGVLRVHRHRLFEANFFIPQLPHLPKNEHPVCHTHDKRKRQYGKTDEWRDCVQVTGGGNSSKAAALDAMGIDWEMTKEEVNEAIPPAYAQYIGRAAIQHIEQRRAA